MEVLFGNSSINDGFRKKNTLPCLIPRKWKIYGEKKEFERVTKEVCDGFIGYLVNTDMHQAPVGFLCTNLVDIL